MSRIGKMPVTIPSAVNVEAADGLLKVKGPKGELQITLRPEVEVALDGGTLNVTRKRDDRHSRAYHGMTRALINNMVEGVTTGYSKALDIVGVGWNASVGGSQVVLNVGFCHPVKLDIPEGVSVKCPDPTHIVVTGADKQAVGQLAARIRKSRPPEPYKGKGVRYRGEYVRMKVGKSFGS